MFCLCTIFAYSQTTQEITGNYYSFRSASISLRNNDTKADVLNHTFNDTISLRDMKELSFPVQPVFLSVFIQSGVLSTCILWNNHKSYSVIDGGQLLLPVTKSYEDLETKSPDDIFLLSYTLPQYTLALEGNTATFTFPLFYGTSECNCTLEGTFTIVLVKDEPYKGI